MSARIFISYSRQNSEFARRLELQLNEHGFQAWLDTHELRMGQLWREEIVQAISACDYFVLLLSSRSVKSENVVRELSLAEASSKPILPVMLEPVEIPDAMKYQLAGLQFVLVESAQVEQAMDALLAVLPTPTVNSDPIAVARELADDKTTPTTEARQEAMAGCWDKNRLEAHLVLAIGPMAAVLLETVRDPLDTSDRDALRVLFHRQALDLSLLEAALAHAWIPQGTDSTAPLSTDPEEESDPLAWLRLQLGPIADVIWDEPLRQALREAPGKARARLETLGVEPRVVEDLLRRCASQ
jgi:hypothetical protein